MTGWRVSLRGRVGDLHMELELQGNTAPVAVAGPNGSGKSTLLRMVAGVTSPIEGEIEVGGRTMYSSRLGIDLPPEDRRVGYVPQGYGLFPHLRVVDNVAFGLCTGPARRPRSERHVAARAMLDGLGCGDLAERFPGRLSGGEQQRVALARALVTQPALLLLDEPLAALDAGARHSVRAFLAERLKTASCPALVVTHDARDAAALGARVCVLERGRLVQEGMLQSLRARPANDFVAEFAGAVDPDRAFSRTPEQQLWDADIG